MLGRAKPQRTRRRRRTLKRWQLASTSVVARSEPRILHRPSGLAQRLEFSLRAELDRWHTPGQAVTLLSRGCSSPQLPASIGGLDTWGLTPVKPQPGCPCTSGGVVVAQRGSALPQATLLNCRRLDRSLVTRRRTLLPGVSTRLRSPSGYTDVKQGREAVATDLSAAMDPGAGEAAARRCSSVTVKDEGLCQTSVHLPIRRMMGSASADSLEDSGPRDRSCHLRRQGLR